MNQLEKLVNKLLEKVTTLGPEEEEAADNDGGITITEEQYDRLMESKCADLRGARAKKTDAFGNKTYADVWDDISDFELDYLKEKWSRISPERRYQYFKEEWGCHNSSYRHRGLQVYDGEGCTDNGCITGCRYLPEEGRIEDSEVESWYQDYRRTRGEENRKRREEAGGKGIHYKIFCPRIDIGKRHTLYHIQ